jgi:hypothetical protein
VLNKEILAKINDLSTESISSIMEALENVDVDELSAAQAFPGRSGKTIEVQDVLGHKYYIGLSEYGFVEIIRSESPTGEIVYIPLDD